MKRSWLVCFFCCLPLFLAAGDGYRFRYIDLPEQLRDAAINGAIADRAGLLWFYTSSGLHRYDGNQLLTFNQVSHPAISSNAITILFPDSKNRMWIGTQNGLVCFDLRSWRTRPVTLEGGGSVHVNEICEGKDGRIYVGCNEGRFLQVQGGRLKVLADLSRIYAGGAVKTGITHLYEAAPGTFWVLSAGRLLQITRGGQVKDAGIEGTVTTPVHFYDSTHAVFQLAGKGMFEGDMRAREWRPLPGIFNDTLNKGKRMLLFPLRGGEIGVFINKRGFFTYNPFTKTSTERMKTLDVNFANLRASNIHSTGNKAFISFNKSVAELEQVRTPFTNLLANPSFESTANSVRSILRHPNGYLYTGTYGNGFISLNETTGEKKVLSGLFVYASLLWDESRLLLATEGDGLLWYHVAANRFEPIKGDTLHTPPQHRMSGTFFTTLCRESDSVVWVGGYNGVYRLNPYTGRTFSPRESTGEALLHRAKIYDIVLAGDRRYFATSQGLFCWRPATQQLQRVLNDPLYAWRRVGNEWWAATNGKGILVLDDSLRLQRAMNTEHGLAGNAVYFLMQQGGEVVAGTDRGLSIVHTGMHRISNYTRMQHLPSNEFNHSAAHYAGGRFYLGTINGLTMFRMEDLAAFSEQPPVPLRFTSFSTGSREGARHIYTLPYQLPERLEVEAGVEYFSLRFGGVDAAAEQVYYYRTDKDAPWLEIGRQREISFAGMAPGSYTVQLAARLSGSTAFTTLLTLPVQVNPAWYQTFWFKLLCLAAVALAVWWIFRYRMQQLLREQRLRTKIAGDLHDEVGSSLTRIYFQADHLLMRHEEKTALQKIADSSKHALSTMSDMVWSIDARFDTAEDLVARIRDYLSNLQNDLDIKCAFDVQGDYARRTLSQATRQNFFLIFKEATNNAARYSSEPCMKVELSFGAHIGLRVVNSCSDNGKMKQYQGGRGIGQMQARAARMKGRLTAGKEGGEFVVYLQVPC